jgi:hypothetical protein
MLLVVSPHRMSPSVVLYRESMFYLRVDVSMLSRFTSSMYTYRGVLQSCSMQCQLTLSHLSPHSFTCLITMVRVFLGCSAICTSGAEYSRDSLCGACRAFGAKERLCLCRLDYLTVKMVRICRGRLSAHKMTRTLSGFGQSPSCIVSHAWG